MHGLFEMAAVPICVRFGKIITESCLSVNKNINLRYDLPLFLQISLLILVPWFFSCCQSVEVIFDDHLFMIILSNKLHLIALFVEAESFFSVIYDNHLPALTSVHLDFSCCHEHNMLFNFDLPHITSSFPSHNHALFSLSASFNLDRFKLM